MVVIRPLEASRSIDIGGIPDTRVDSSIGQGLAQVGNAIGNHADMQNQMQMRRVQMEKQLSEFKTDQEFERFQADRKADFIKIKDGTDPSGQGLTEATVKNYHENATEFIRNVPDFLKPKYSELLLTGNVAVNHFAAGQQAGMMHDWSATNITERAQKLQIDIANNPDSYADAKKNIIDYIDAAPGLSKSEREQAKKDAEKFFAAGVGDNIKARAAQDPNAIADLSGKLGISGLRGSPVDVVVNQIIGVESSGRAGAKNPNSSASGLGQFIDSTWLGMVRKHRPDIAAGRSNAEIIALKTDPKLGREMTRAYTLENAQFLANQGIEQTAGNIYLAHFLGPRGAVQVLKADPSTPIENIVGPQVVQANGFLRGKSASEVAAWATGKMGNKSASGVPVDPRFSQMSLDERLKLYDEAMAIANTGITKRNAEWTARSNQENDRIRFGIVQGTITSEQDIANNSYLDLGQRAERITQFRTAQKGIIQTQADIVAVNGGGFSGDPYNSDFKKRVDNAGDFVRKNLPSDQAQSFIENMVRQSGSIDEGTVNSLRLGAESQTPSNVQQALELGSRLSSINRNAISTRDGGSSVQDKIDLYDSLKKNGYEASEAAKRVAELNDPELVAKRQAIVKSEPVQKVLKKVSSSDVKKIYSGWFSSAGVGGQPKDETVKVGASFQAEAQIVADYKGMLEDAFYEANGNETVARDLAAKRMQKVYGLSETSFFGNNTIMRLPPEKTYDPLPDGSFGYIKEQLHEALKAEGVDFDDAWLESYDLTEQDHQAGRPANYQIVFSKNGNIGLYNLPFFADREAALQKYNAGEQERVAKREAAWEQSRANEALQYPEGRDGPERFANDQLYRGVAREGSPMARAIAAQQQKTNAELQALPTDQERNQKIDQFLGKPRALISNQRKQLFKDAKDNGTLPER